MQATLPFSWASVSFICAFTVEVDIPLEQGRLGLRVCCVTSRSAPFADMLTILVCTSTWRNTGLTGTKHSLPEMTHNVLKQAVMDLFGGGGGGAGQPGGAHAKVSLAPRSVN
jgi:hypothetical protein